MNNQNGNDPNNYNNGYNNPNNPNQSYNGNPPNNGGSNYNGGNYNKPPVTAADIPLLLKARYFGSGMVVGVFISPAVRNLVGRFQPKLDSLMDTLTGQAEGLFEKGSDIMAKAKDAVRKMDREESIEHKHDGDHGHSHSHGPRKPEGTA